MKYKQKIFTLIVALTALISFKGVLAQEIEAVKVVEGDVSTIVLYLNTDGFNLNAVEGVINLDRTKESDVTLIETGSVVSIWINKPSLSFINGDLKITFSGITPGGFNGRFKLFSINVPKSTVISLESSSVYLNDGLGTEKKVALKERDSLPDEAKVILSEVVRDFSNDKIKPEPFTSIIATSTELFDGKLFISFLAQDKQSGIDYYEVAERKYFPAFFYSTLNWKKYNSPYLLLDQSRKSHIYVKAVDRGQNYQVSVIRPIYTSATRLTLIIITIILGVALWVGLRRQRFF